MSKEVITKWNALMQAVIDEDSIGSKKFIDSLTEWRKEYDKERGESK